MRITKFALIILLLAGRPDAGRIDAEPSPASPGGESPPVTAPPEHFFRHFDAKDQPAARAFYKKYLEINGLPLAAAGEVSDQALQRDYDIVTHMLAGRPDILQTMVNRGPA